MAKKKIKKKTKFAWESPAVSPTPPTPPEPEVLIPQSVVQSFSDATTVVAEVPAPAPDPLNSTPEKVAMAKQKELSQKIK